MSESKEIKILSWNADGVRTKLHELLDLATSELCTDIIALCETRLTSNITLETPGYICHRADKHLNGHGQGVAILIKTDIEHSRVAVPHTRHMEAIGIEMTLSGKKLTILSIYQSPNLPLDPSDLSALLNIGRNVLIMGDFNAKHAHWKCPDTNSRGNILLDHMLENDYIIHYTPNPTLVHYNSNYQPTTPDLVLSQNVHDICDIRTLPALSSNHLPVAFSVVGNFTRKSLEYFRYCDADWTGFRSHVNDNITLSSNFFSSISEIDNALNSFMELLLEARSKFVPTGKLNNHNKTLPREIKQTIKIKNRVRRLMLKEDNQDVRSSLRTTFNSLNHNIRRGIRELQDKIWNKKLSKVDNPSSDLWRLAKSIRSKPIIIPPLAKPDGTKTKSTKDQCEILADAFHENMSLTLNWQSDNENTVAASLETINCFQPYRIYKPTRPREIWSIIRKLKLRKAPGYDGIHNALLKNLPQKAVILLTKILNACLRISYFPQAWKLAKVIAILKSGKDACLGTSYRPISLLSSLSKLFESVIYKRLIATTHHLLRNEQFGFRKSHSTTQQLARVAEHVAHHLNLGQSTGMFLLDIEKAFDTVWHDGLLHKLVINQVPLGLVKLVQSYLDNRQFFVQVDDYTSSIRIPPAGVPQGSILGPYLFLLFLNDIPIQTRTKLACFADDTACFTSSRDPDLVIDRLQLSINLLLKYFTSWKLKLNESKTEAVLFTRKRKIPNKRLQINGISIPWKPSVKYLGVHLDKKLNWTYHVTQIRSKGIKALNALNPIFNRRCNLSPQTKLRFYTGLIRPCITYAAPVWSSTCKTNYSKLQVIQNKSLKIVFNTPFRTNLTNLHDKINFPRLYDFILKATRKFYLEKNPNNPNTLVSTIGQSRLENLSYIDKYRRYRLPHHLVLGE